jgi:hypothetical protein
MADGHGQKYFKGVSAVNLVNTFLDYAQNQSKAVVRSPVAITGVRSG